MASIVILTNVISARFYTRHACTRAFMIMCGRMVISVCHCCVQTERSNEPCQGCRGKNVKRIERIERRGCLYIRHKIILVKNYRAFIAKLMISPRKVTRYPKRNSTKRDGDSSSGIRIAIVFRGTHRVYIRIRITRNIYVRYVTPHKRIYIHKERYKLVTHA